MFDREVLRNLELIEEREIYENEFIQVEDILKSDELDYYTCPQFEEYFLEDFVYDDNKEGIDLEFDFEDYFVQLRDELLIEQRELYENEYFSITNEIVEPDILDMQIEAFEEDDFGLDYDFYEDYYTDLNCHNDYPDFECYDDYYVEEYNMDAAYCGGKLFGYIVDECDGFDECDYPEGPDENIDGFKFPEPCYYYDLFDYSDPCFDFPDDFYDCPEPDYEFEDPMGLDLYECEESHMQNLIDRHLEEEKQFMKFLASEEIPDKYCQLETGENIIILN